MLVLIMGVSLLIIIKFTEKNATAIAMVAVVVPTALLQSLGSYSSFLNLENKQYELRLFEL